MDKQKIFIDENVERQPFKVELYTAVAVMFLIAAALSVKFFQSDKVASFHEEIFPSNAISYIKDNELVELRDGELL